VPKINTKLSTTYSTTPLRHDVTTQKEPHHQLAHPESELSSLLLNFSRNSRHFNSEKLSVSLKKENRSASKPQNETFQHKEQNVDSTNTSAGLVHVYYAFVAGVDDMNLIPHILQRTVFLESIRYARDTCTQGEHKFSST
jgi:hypothetical protein